MYKIYELQQSINFKYIYIYAANIDGEKIIYIHYTDCFRIYSYTILGVCSPATNIEKIHKNIFDNNFLQRYHMLEIYFFLARS